MLGQSWLIRHAAKIDYSHEQVLVEHNNITHVLSCGLHNDTGNPVLNVIECQQHLREEDSMFFYGIMTDIEDEMMIDLNGAAVQSASDREKPLKDTYAQVFKDLPAGLPPDRGNGTELISVWPPQFPNRCIGYLLKKSLKLSLWSAKITLLKVGFSPVALHTARRYYLCEKKTAL